VLPFLGEAAFRQRLEVQGNRLCRLSRPVPRLSRPVPTAVRAACPLSPLFSTAAGGPSGGATRVSLGLTKSLQLVRALAHAAATSAPHVAPCRNVAIGSVEADNNGKKWRRWNMMYVEQ
jgi:hypothetical protein